jgi:hypothetical protein
MTEFVETNPHSPHPTRTMTLAEFMQNAGTDEIKAVFSLVRRGNFSACHVAFYKSTGIWIPELVPVFQKLDAMMVMQEEIQIPGVHP